MDTGNLPPTFDTTKPHSARVWNYWLGGKDHFAVDREQGDRLFNLYPQIVEVARAQRAFHGRAVRFLAAEAGVRQFLDVGAGLPTADNTHDVAQRVDPACRVVYVDNDPLVLVHARALLTGTPEGATAYVDADARDPKKILTEAADTLDFTQPVALMLLGVMGMVPDLGEAYAVVRQLLAALPAGSYLALTDGTLPAGDERLAAALDSLCTAGPGEGQPGHGYHLRTREEITRFFDGLDPVEPGIVSAPLWRPDPTPRGEKPPQALDMCSGVAR